MPLEITNLDPLAQVRIVNGAVFVARQVQTAEKFSIAALIGAGALHGAPSVAHFLEHALLAGREGIADYFDDRGGSAGACTLYDATIYHGDLHAEHFEGGIREIASVVCRPAFAPGHIGAVARDITAEWARRCGQQARQRMERVYRAAFGRSSLSDILGTPEILRTIGAGDISAFHRRHYTASNLVVYMQGPAEHERMLDAAMREFALPAGGRAPLPPLTFRPSTVCAPAEDIPATHATLVFPGTPIGVSPRQDQIMKICREMLCEAVNGAADFEIAADSYRAMGWGVTVAGFDAPPADVPVICRTVMEYAARLATGPDIGVFEAVKRRRMDRISQAVASYPEQDPLDQVLMIRASGIVHPLNAYLQALPGVAMKDIAAYAAEHLAERALSVVYEGAVEGGFPDHRQLAAIALTPPARRGR